MSELHLVFVYGTLKQGFPNDGVNHGRRCPGDFVSVEPHPFFVLRQGGLPWLVNQPGHGLRVVGEVYEVDDAGLARMDRLEQIDEPGWYERRRIAVRPASGGEVLKPWVYFGVAERAAREPVLAGPLAVYTTELAASYRKGA